MTINVLEPLSFPRIGKETGISDSCKAFGEDVGKKSANEFHCRKGNRFLLSGIPVRYGKGDRLFVIILDPAVGDGRAESVPGKILNGVAVSVKGFDNLSNPFHFVKPVAKRIPAIGISIGVFFRKHQEILLPEPFYGIHHFSAK